MKKSDFAKLKKLMNLAPVAYMQMAGGKYYLADGHFVAWVPENVFRQYLADDFPVLAEGEQAKRARQGSGSWNIGGGVDLRRMVDKLLHDSDHTAAFDTKVQIEVKDGMQVRLIEARELVRLAVHFFDMAVTLCGGSRIYGSTHKTAVWFYSDEGAQFDSIGCMVLPVNYNGAEQLAKLEHLYRAAGGKVEAVA